MKTPQSYRKWSNARVEPWKPVRRDSSCLYGSFSDDDRKEGLEYEDYRDEKAQLNELIAKMNAHQNKNMLRLE